MHHLLTFLFLLSLGLGCRGQAPSNERAVGGPCQGCEALLEYAPASLGAQDTVPGFHSFSPRFKVTGIVYEADGKTPAADIILYIYQTDTAGLYTPGPEAQGWGTRHGQHRAWVKTGADGRYTFYTFRPAAYPNRKIPEHIHLTVKEPETIPYYLDSFQFEDDPLLSPAEREKQKNRGGSGIVRTRPHGNMWEVNRDIFLGKNIPAYN